MARLEYRSISNRTVEALSVEKDTVFWDSGMKGFGVRVYPSGSKVYVVQSRGPRGAKRVTVGRHGVISSDQARQRAASIIARIKAGGEPVPKRPTRGEAGPTVAEFAQRYFREHVEVRCKPSTVRSRPARSRQPHIARAGEAAHLRARPGAHQQSALQPPRHTYSRKQGN